MTFDTGLFSLIHDLQGTSVFLDFLAEFFAGYVLYILLFLFVMVILFERRKIFQIRYVLFSSLILLLSRGIFTELIRLFVHRERPYQALEFQPLFEASGYSFPSGHAAFLFALSFAMYTIRKKWGIYFFVAACLVSLSRIFGGVHYPLDIIGGFFVALFSFYITKRVFPHAPHLVSQDAKKSEEFESVQENVDSSHEEISQ
jgi:undecaprenyl-diphosphatase